MQYAGRKRSFWGSVVDRLVGRQPGAPPAPQPPPVDQSAWGKSVDQARISDHLTVRDLGLIVFNETQSYSDRPDSNEPISMARQKLAHAVTNGDQRWGAERMKWASTALPIEPSANALRNPAVKAAYESSMKAAREAYLSGTDPTGGALFHFQATSPDRSNLVYPGGLPEGVPLITQSGPYSNSFPNRRVPSRVAWLNNYLEK